MSEYIYESVDINVPLLQSEIIATELGEWLESITFHSSALSVVFSATLSPTQVEILDGLVGVHDSSMVYPSDTGQMIWWGEWLNDTLYVSGSVISWGGLSWVALVDSLGSEPPSADWFSLAS